VRHQHKEKSKVQIFLLLGFRFKNKTLTAVDSNCHRRLKTIKTRHIDYLCGNLR